MDEENNDDEGDCDEEGGEEETEKEKEDDNEGDDEDIARGKRVSGGDGSYPPPVQKECNFYTTKSKNRPGAFPGGTFSSPILF